MAVNTLEGAPFLAINGVQTLSHGVHLIDIPAAALREAGVRALRLSPHTGDMTAVILAFRRFIDGDITSAALSAAVQAAGPPGDLVSGYLHGVAGLRPAGAI